MRNIQNKNKINEYNSMYMLKHCDQSKGEMIADNFIWFYNWFLFFLVIAVITSDLRIAIPSEFYILQVSLFCYVIFVPPMQYHFVFIDDLSFFEFYTSWQRVSFFNLFVHASCVCGLPFFNLRAFPFQPFHLRLLALISDGFIQTYTLHVFWALFVVSISSDQKFLFSYCISLFTFFLFILSLFHQF